MNTKSVLDTVTEHWSSFKLNECIINRFLPLNPFSLFPSRIVWVSRELDNIFLHLWDVVWTRYYFNVLTYLTLILAT